MSGSKTDSPTPQNKTNTGSAALRTLPQTRQPMSNPKAALGIARLTGGNLASILLQHNPEQEQSPTTMLMTQFGDTLFLARSAKSHAVNGYQAGKAESQADLAARKARTISIPRETLEDPTTRATLRADLATLAGDDRTALNLNSRMTPTAVFKAFDAAEKKPGNSIEIDLSAVGIRTTPNTKRVLNTYADGGREELVALGILGREPVGPASAFADRSTDHPANPSPSRAKKTNAADKSNQSDTGMGR